MSLIQPFKIREVVTGLYKIHGFETSRFKIEVFKTEITVVFVQCPEATVTLTAIWKRGVSKRGILESPVSYVLNFLGWIKLIFDTAY